MVAGHIRPNPDLLISLCLEYQMSTAPLGHHTTNADHPHKKYTHKVSPKCSLLENEYIKSFSKLKSQNQAYHALAEVINSNLEL